MYSSSIPVADFNYEQPNDCHIDIQYEFINSSTGDNNFFSVGKKNQWKSKLKKEQLKKIERKFGKTMKFFNYKLNVEI